MGSPLYAELARSAASDYETDAQLRGLLDANASLSRIGLRLLGAAHFRALAGQASAIAAHFPSTGGDGDAKAAWNAVRDDVHAHAPVYAGLLRRSVQTNEVARAMPVLGAMLTVAAETRMPLRVFEVGSSAGLLLHFDRYRYSGENWSWGDPDSALHLRNAQEAGAPAHLDADLEIATRRGCDLHPLDLSKPADADTLLSFLWPDQLERFERMRSAIAIAASEPVAIDRANGEEWMRRVAEPAPGFACVVFHTVMLEHLSAADRDTLAQRITSMGSRATRSAPFAWARMEQAAERYETSVTLWPGGDQIAIATSDGHAQHLRWESGP